MSYDDLVQDLKRDLQPNLNTDIVPFSQCALPDYIVPPLGPGWAPVSGAALAGPGYYIDNVGRVNLSGIAIATAAATGDVLFTLPVGYRPIATRVYIIPDGINPPPAIAHARVDVQPNGRVVWQTGGGAHVIALDGISFRADH